MENQVQIWNVLSKMHPKMYKNIYLEALRQSISPRCDASVEAKFPILCKYHQKYKKRSKLTKICLIRPVEDVLNSHGCLNKEVQVFFLLELHLSLFKLLFYLFKPDFRNFIPGEIMIVHMSLEVIVIFGFLQQLLKVSIDPIRPILSVLIDFIKNKLIKSLPT